MHLRALKPTTVLATAVVASAASLAAAAAPAATAHPATKRLLNLDKQGVALQGYDPVAFFADEKAVKGSPQLQAMHDGAIYYFATAEHQQAFLKDPARYEPQFGGFCAFGVSVGRTAPVDITTWQVYEGRLVLNYNAAVRKRFDADRPGNLAKADRNWPAIVEHDGKAPAQ